MTLRLCRWLCLLCLCLCLPRLLLMLVLVLLMLVRVLRVEQEQEHTYTHNRTLNYHQQRTHNLTFKRAPIRFSQARRGVRGEGVQVRA